MLKNSENRKKIEMKKNHAFFNFSSKNKNEYYWIRHFKNLQQILKKTTSKQISKSINKINKVIQSIVDRFKTLYLKKTKQYAITKDMNLDWNEKIE